MSNPGILVYGAAAVFWFLSAIAWWRASRPFEADFVTVGEQLIVAFRRTHVAASFAVAAALLQALTAAAPAIGLWE
jgi:hypothetical protein